MSELLAIFGPHDSDSELIAEIARMHPRRVTVLLDAGDEDWALDDSPAGKALRERMARLMALIESSTGASVTGLAGNRDQLEGWRFDRELSCQAPLTAHR